MSKPWSNVKLGEVLRQRKEFVTIDDIKTYRRPRVQLHTQGIMLRDQIPGALIKTKQQQICRAGEFLVAEIDAKVGGFGMVPVELDGVIVSSHYFLFAVDEAKLMRDFLGWYVRTPAFGNQVRAQGTTNYAAIRPADVLAYEIPLPPLAEQRRIVARIEELAAKIGEARSLRQYAVAETEALLMAARSNAILHCDADAISLEDCCTTVIDNLHSNPRYSETGIPCVRSPDVGYGTLNLEKALRTDENEYRRRTVRGKPIEDDIVLVREGGGTGKCALVSKGQRFSLGQRVMMLRLNQQKVLPRFFLHQMLSPLVQEKQIGPLCKGSASPHLNIGALRGLHMRIPPLTEQRRVAAYLDVLQSKMDALKKLQGETSAELDALMPSVLDKAFKGEL